VARPLYSVQFISQTLVESDIAIYDVPAGFVAVIREIDVYINTIGETQAINFECLTSYSYCKQWQAPPGMLDTVDWQGHYVGSPGPDIVEFGTSGFAAEGFCTVNVSGFLLSVP